VILTLARLRANRIRSLRTSSNPKPDRLGVTSDRLLNLIGHPLDPGADRQGHRRRDSGVGLPFFIAFLVVFFRNIREGNFRWRAFWPLAWPALIPALWFEILSSHSQIHARVSSRRRGRGFWGVISSCAAGLGCEAFNLLWERRLIRRSMQWLCLKRCQNLKSAWRSRAHGFALASKQTCPATGMLLTRRISSRSRFP
jgi:hypothetical protein